MQPHSTLPKAVRDLARELLRLPGIGPKTAQRLSIHLLRQSSVAVERLAETIKSLHDKVKICGVCYNLAEEETCVICRDQNRDPASICVVEDALDVDAIERTQSFLGRYHVLGGVLSPMDGITSDKLTLEELFTRLHNGQVKEIIIALDHNMESEATTRYITQQLAGKNITITRLARGLPTGGDIEFADALTLTAAMSGRKTV